MHTVVCSVTRGDSGRHAMTLRTTIWQRGGERSEDRRRERCEDRRYREGVKRGGKESPRGEERAEKRRREVERRGGERREMQMGEVWVCLVAF